MAANLDEAFRVARILYDYRRLVSPENRANAFCKTMGWGDRDSRFKWETIFDTNGEIPFNTMGHTARCVYLRQAMEWDAKWVVT